MRPYWKGYLKLALVSCPIALHAACSSAERISFRQINKATGNRLRQQRKPASRSAPSTRAAATRWPRVREAMRHKTRVALGRLVLAKRERVIALEP
jgi:non-homologous end joining protein Ku